MDKLVSIIIPVYNATKSMRKCVESLVYGKYRNIEVILVDDCSTDGSWELCVQLSKEFPCVKCFRNKQNSGPSATRNRGLQELTGDYVCFVDSDDWVSGRYILELVQEFESNPDKLIICGFKFINLVDHFREDYVWDSTSTTTSDVDLRDSFSVLAKVMMQNVWNKMFSADVIRKCSLSFDTTKRMGEDFDFVLDYIENAACDGYRIINRALYYYVRASSQSLMSQFGLTSFEEEKTRYFRVYTLCGKCVEKTLYLASLDALKQNFIYHVMHKNELSATEKIKHIQEITHDGQAQKYYLQQSGVILREFIVSGVYGCKTLLKRIRGKANQGIAKYRINNARKLVSNIPVTIISQNCIGGVVYHDLGWQFRSPTINLYMNAPDFVKFVLNIEEYLSQTMEMHWDEENPIGELGDINIHFMHYHTCTQAKEMWNRRSARIEWNNIVVVSTDRDGFTDETFKHWKEIPYPKVLFTANSKFRDHADSVFYPEYSKEKMVADLIPARKIYRGNLMVMRINHLIS